jgi:hypothetical protein
MTDDLVADKRVLNAWITQDIAINAIDIYIKPPYYEFIFTVLLRLEAALQTVFRFSGQSTDCASELLLVGRSHELAPWFYIS